MRTATFLILIGLFSGTAAAQTKTTDQLHKKYEDAFTLFFYNSTLRMFNQAEDKDFDELIRDIEKMKFLMIEKNTKGFDKADYAQLIKDYKGESYESVMTARMEGKNFDVYVRQAGSRVKGTVILVNDSTNLYVLDILGRVPMTKVSSLFNVMEKSDVGKQAEKFFKGKKGVVVE